MFIAQLCSKAMVQFAHYSQLCKASLAIALFPITSIHLVLGGNLTASTPVSMNRPLLLLLFMYRMRSLIKVMLPMVPSLLGPFLTWRREGN